MEPKDDSSDYNFGKFGKFQEKYMFHNKAQRLFNLAMESSTNYTNSKRYGNLALRHYIRLFGVCFIVGSS